MHNIENMKFNVKEENDMVIMNKFHTQFELGRGKYTLSTTNSLGAE
jgi:hypothetical protein